MRGDKYLIYKFVVVGVPVVAFYGRVERLDSTAPIDSVRWQLESLARKAACDLLEPAAPGARAPVNVQCYRLDVANNDLVEVPSGTYLVPPPCRDYLQDEFIAAAKEKLNSVDPAFHDKFITLARESKTNYSEALEEIDRLVVVYQIGR